MCVFVCGRVARSSSIAIGASPLHKCQEGLLRVRARITPVPGFQLAFKTAGEINSSAMGGHRGKKDNVGNINKNTKTKYTHTII